MWKYIMCNICVLYYILYAQYMYIQPIAYCTYIHMIVVFRTTTVVFRCYHVSHVLLFPHLARG